ncbi:MAG TPA: FAD-binding oxidoreductase [Nocardioides sp.]|uniref:NAD(P)/FAD-dependent oxidoreductase n=1 Tax=Nocardioides sp. TaxID=35761 RepID=UPI002E336A34|nr:FAD-binding oxidoreductase [Nocardioides sp.]HEX3931008.1 FAD-binding oxidoreductase [Nocardioides sp.]
MGCPLSYRSLSLWHESVPDDWSPRPALPGDRDVDVAIVGAGFTGLWTALYLARAEPSLRIAVVEAETAGFGASGRNGGWCSALFPSSLDSIAKRSTREGALALHAAMRGSVDEVLAAAELEGIDAQAQKGGTISLARSAPQWARARGHVDDARSWGLGEDDVRLLDAAEATEVLAGTRVRGATYTPHCAAIHPSRLVRGLAEAVARRGVTIYEQTPATAIAPGSVATRHGIVRAEHVIRATEGYTRTLAGQRRAIVPVYSLIVATEPLSPQVWEQIGLRRRETFSDHRHLIIYGQRTADDRLVFGGRGAPYHFGSRLRPGYDLVPRVFEGLWATLVDLFPVVSDAKVTHRWGGALGIARDWTASVGLDRSTGLGWAGGYVGDGVGTTNLAGRTLADLVLRRDTELTRLPWVDHRSRSWEPEPLRWLGINAGLRAMTWADAEEARTGRESRIARVVSPFIH